LSGRISLYWCHDYRVCSVLQINLKEVRWQTYKLACNAMRSDKIYAGGDTTDWTISLSGSGRLTKARRPKKQMTNSRTAIRQALHTRVSFALFSG
jgi:hypothetical protein